ncbi:lipocalin family protein [Winogradskyella luteola]|uniref:Lipocalin family protein n=1 Tax=Winogradskyella luteola TaxID=2828330 RepID=A0A9X1F926_9FLAO|nr:lipocalin family protein [Winogradskyella luteola]MBV7268205.1 lipocalin family protein [Winogradskyella luteola]
MKVGNSILFRLILFVIITSCASEKFELPENAPKLLTNDSSKTWMLAKRYNDGYRMNMGDCFLSYRITYNSDGTTVDNNYQNENCGESLEANWTFYTNDDGAYIKLKGEKVKVLLKQEKDYKFFKIEALSDTLLVVSFKHKQFGNKERTVKDYLVPEDAIVKDRNYHN